jgi:hypothetical protein
MEYFIPIQFVTLIDMIDRINEIAVDIQNDIIQYNLLSTSIKHKDCKKIIYHHLIKGLCESAIRRNFNETYFVYSSHRLSFTKLNTIFDSAAAEIKKFLEDLITICKKTVGLQIVDYNGGAKKLYDDYTESSGVALSTISSYNRVTTKNDKQTQLKFFQKYGLKHLFNNHFKNVNYLILTSRL